MDVRTHAQHENDPRTEREAMHTHTYKQACPLCCGRQITVDTPARPAEPQHERNGPTKQSIRQPTWPAGGKHAMCTKTTSTPLATVPARQKRQGFRPADQKGRGTHLHGKGSRPYRRDGAPAEVPGVLPLLEGGAHEHQPQVRPLGQQPSQHDQQELAVAVPLVDLSSKRTPRAKNRGGTGTSAMFLKSACCAKSRQQEGRLTTRSPLTVRWLASV